MTYTKVKQLEYSAYLILQILNKVVAEHRYPFRVFVYNNKIIDCVAELSKLNSKMLNIEIVKFYKAIIRSKDTHYISLIVTRKLFYPINNIFEATYDAKNPPMI